LSLKKRQRNCQPYGSRHQTCQTCFDSRLWAWINIGSGEDSSSWVRRHTDTYPPTHQQTHTHIHHDKLIAISAQPYYVVGADYYQELLTFCCLIKLMKKKELAQAFLSHMHDKCDGMSRTRRNITRTVRQAKQCWNLGTLYATARLAPSILRSTPFDNSWGAGSVCRPSLLK